MKALTQVPHFDVTRTEFRLLLLGWLNDGSHGSHWPLITLCAAVPPGGAVTCQPCVTCPGTAANTIVWLPQTDDGETSDWVPEEKFDSAIPWLPPITEDTIAVSAPATPADQYMACHCQERHIVQEQQACWYTTYIPLWSWVLHCNERQAC